MSDEKDAPYSREYMPDAPREVCESCDEWVGEDNLTRVGGDWICSACVAAQAAVDQKLSEMKDEGKLR